MMSKVAELFVSPRLFTASGRRQSSLEIAFDETARQINAFWKKRADLLLGALSNTQLYGVTLETQRFPSRLPAYLRRLALYFDSVGMVDLLHLPDGDSLESMLSDPRKRSLKMQSLFWFMWMLRASEVATIDPIMPIFLPLPNTPHSPTANSQMSDLAAQYLGDHIPSLKGITSSDALRDFLGTGELSNTLRTDAFSRLVDRFGDDEGVVASPLSGEVHPRDLHEGTGSMQIRRIHELLATTFSCARETVLASLPVGWDPVFYGRNAFLHKWFFEQASPNLAVRKNDTEIQPEQTAVDALVGTDLEFLEAVNAEDIRRVRDGQMYKELRSVLSLSRAEFKVASRRSPEAAVQAFVAQIRNAIDHFGAKYKEFKRERKSARWRAGVSFAGVTSLTALTLTFPSAALLGWLGGGASVLIGGKSLLDLAQMEKKADRNIKELEANPLMLLYRASLRPEDG